MQRPSNALTSRGAYRDPGMPHRDVETLGRGQELHCPTYPAPRAGHGHQASSLEPEAQDAGLESPPAARPRGPARSGSSVQLRRTELVRRPASRLGPRRRTEKGGSPAGARLPHERQECDPSSARRSTPRVAPRAPVAPAWTGLARSCWIAAHPHWGTRVRPGRRKLEFLKWNSQLP